MKVSLLILLVTLIASSQAFRLRSSIVKSSVTFRLAAFKSFDEMLEKVEVPVLVDFYAEWCGPCRMMAPVLEDIAGRLENEIKVAKVDTDKSPRLGNKYQIEALPTLILFNKGVPVERFLGYRSADDLERDVKKVLNRIRSAP